MAVAPRCALWLSPGCHMFNILKKEDSYTVTKVLCMLLEWQSVLIIDASSKKLSLAVVSFFFMHVNTHAIVLNTLLLCLDTTVLPGWMVILRGTGWTNH